MKSCPACNRTYPDDTLAFCLVDGSVLSAPYDPSDAQSGAARRGSNSTQTQILQPTVPSASAPSIEPTMLAAKPQVPSLHPSAPSLLESQQSKSKAPWIIAGVAILLAGVLGVVLLASQFAGKSDTTTKQPDVSVPAKVETRSNLACNSPLSAEIYDKWIELGGEKGRMRCPVEAESEAPESPQGTTGRWVRFSEGDGGYIVLHKSGANAGKAFEVSGCIYKVYASLGGTKSWLGFPVSDGREIKMGARQDFEEGYVLWDSKTYECQAHKN